MNDNFRTLRDDAETVDGVGFQARKIGQTIWADIGGLGLSRGDRIVCSGVTYEILSIQARPKSISRLTYLTVREAPLGAPNA